MLLRSLGAAALFLASGASASAQIIPFLDSVDSPDNRPYYAVEAVGMGDVTGDGFPEFAVAEISGTTTAPPGVVYVYSGADLSILHTFTGKFSRDDYGSALARIGDVDQDGIDDLLIGAPGDDTFDNAAGRVEVRSGADGSLIREHLGSERLAILGEFVAAGADHDGDGVRDYLVSEGGVFTTRALVYSGATGSILHVMDDPRYGVAYPDSLGQAGDLDGDGTPEVLMSKIQFSHNGVGNPGKVIAYSTSQGILWEAIGDSYQEHLGREVDGLGDVNGDGVPDILAGAPGDLDANDERVGAVHVLSGADGSTLFVDFGEPGRTATLGQRVKALGDINGDGVDDFAGVAAYPGTVGSTGYVRFYSGADFRILFHIESEEPYDFFGSAFADLGDWNGDRLPDFLVGAKGSRNAHLVTTMGAQAYGAIDEPAQILDLAWTPSAGPDPAVGVLGSSNAEPNAFGLLLVSTEMFEGTLGEATVLVDLNAPGAFLDVLRHDAAGTFSLPETSLRSPSLDGLRVFTQVLAIDSRAPRNIASSAAVAFLLGD